MRISETTYAPTARTTKKKRASSADSAAFSEILSDAEGVSDAAPVTDAALVSPVQNMLSIQEVSDDDLQRKQAIRAGFEAIDMLETWRNALLMGTLSESQIQRLSDIVNQQKERCTDPKLQDILDDIELRSAVELAKIEMAEQAAST